MSLLNGPFTDTRKTGPDSQKSNHSINTLITTPSVTINEIFPINEGQVPTEGPDPLPESSDLLNEIKSFLDPENDLQETDHHQLPNHTYPNTKTITMTPSISHISDPPAKPADSDIDKHHSYPKKGPSKDSTPVITQNSTPTRSKPRLFYPLISHNLISLMSTQTLSHKGTLYQQWYGWDNG